MANSLEVRVPFLDHHLVEYIFSLKSNVYFDEKIQKKPLQNILKQYFKTTVFNRPKQGFVGPDKYYMNYEIYRKELVNGFLVKYEIIQQNYIQNLLNNKDHWRLWKLFVLENWWQQNIENNEQ
jgi:asparagine synthase (glutamine-hydrolysing)